MNMPTVNICVRHVNWIPFPLDMPTKDSDSLVNYNHLILVIVPTRFVGYKFALIKCGKVVQSTNNNNYPQFITGL